ncbi:hypothetical protein D3C80_733530 [compost metagenome]
MRTGGSHQQGAFCRQLALDFTEVRVRLADQQQAIGLVGLDGFLAIEVRNQLQQVLHCKHFQPRGQAGFLGIFPGHHQGAASIACGQGGGQYALHRTHAAGECQLAQAFDIQQRCGGYLPAGGEDAQGNGQIEAAAVFRQVRRGQIEGNAACGEFEAGVEHGAAYPVLAFLDRGFRQANQGQRRQAIGQVCLDRDGRGHHADLGAAVDDGEGHDRSMLTREPHPAVLQG